MAKVESEKGFYPILSIEERDRRWQNIQWKMDLHGLDCLLVWGNESKWKTALANIRYITNKIFKFCYVVQLDLKQLAGIETQ